MYVFSELKLPDFYMDLMSMSDLNEYVSFVNYKREKAIQNSKKKKAKTYTEKNMDQLFR